MGDRWRNRWRAQVRYSGHWWRGWIGSLWEGIYLAANHQGGDVARAALRIRAGARHATTRLRRDRDEARAELACARDDLRRALESSSRCPVCDETFLTTDGASIRDALRGLLACIDELRGGGPLAGEGLDLAVRSARAALDGE